MDAGNLVVGPAQYRERTGVLRNKAAAYFFDFCQGAVPAFALYDDALRMTRGSALHCLEFTRLEPPRMRVAIKETTDC